MNYSLKPWQQFVVDCDAPVLVVNAGRRTGKTTTVFHAFKAAQSRSEIVRVLRLPPIPQNNNPIDRVRDFQRGDVRLDLLLIDEAAYHDDDLITEAMAALKPFTGRAILMSSPRYTEGLFYHLWATPMANVQKLSVPTASMNHIPDAELAAATMQLGEEGYRNSFCCEFIQRNKTA